MEKLIKLLNQFEREVYPEDHKFIRYPDGTETDGGYWKVGDGFNFKKKGEIYYSQSNTFRDGHEELLIVSKSYGFIKWLAENDKIDYDMIIDKLGIPCMVRYNNGEINCVKDVENYKQILMLLSISDNPISDLCSYLK